MSDWYGDMCDRETFFGEDPDYRHMPPALPPRTVCDAKWIGAFIECLIEKRPHTVLKPEATVFME